MGEGPLRSAWIGLRLGYLHQAGDARKLVKVVTDVRDVVRDVRLIWVERFQLLFIQRTDSIHRCGLRLEVHERSRAQAVVVLHEEQGVVGHEDSAHPVVHTILSRLNSEHIPCYSIAILRTVLVELYCNTSLTLELCRYRHQYIAVRYLAAQSKRHTEAL